MSGVSETLLVTTLLVCVSGAGTSAYEAEDLDYCQSEMFRAECDEDEVIVMHRARYGRLGEGRCVGEDFGFLGQCGHSVLAEMDTHCSGRRSCELKVEDPTFPSKTCHKDLKSFLSATYSCVKVHLPSERCEFNQGEVLTKPEGYISSEVSRNTGCGLTSAPWTIQLNPGQTLNVTLIDFNWANASETEKTPHPNPCTVYVTIRDASNRPSKTVCGEMERQRLIYASEMNAVEIRVMGSAGKSQSKKEPVFLLHYQAIGCPQAKAPPGGWFKQLEEGVVQYGCNNSGTQWRLQCEGSHWVGHMYNCTSAVNIFTGKMTVTEDSILSQYGIRIGLIVLIAILVSAFILVSGIFCIRHKLRLESRRAAMVTTTTTAGGVARTSVNNNTESGLVLSKTCHVATPPLPPYPSEHGLGSRENEYASMRLLPAGPDGMYDKQRRQSVRDGIGPEHIYESPEPDRKAVSIVIPGSRQPGYGQYGTVSAQYIDLDPQMIAVHGGHVGRSREVSYCTCMSQTPGDLGRCNKHSV